MGEAQKVSYEEYLKMNDDKRYEIYYGFIYAMSPAPSSKHQKLLGNLHYYIRSIIKKGKCQIFLAPFDVKLSENDESGNNIDSVVQPDISVVCDNSKLTRRGCDGAPDMIIEITSPGTANRDYKTKFELYEKFKVKEYWIVNASENIVQIFSISESGEYCKPKVYSKEDKIPLNLFNNVELDLKDIFDDELENELD